MSSIIVALPKIEDAKRVGRILANHGFGHVVPCSTASAVLSEVAEGERGLVICSCRLPDMYYTGLAEYLPRYYELLLLGSRSALSEADGSTMSLPMPLKVYDLVNTVEMMLSQIERRYKKDRKGPKKRTGQEEKDILNAKRLLMERNHLSEEAAYRYIQKCSMDSGTGMAETAQMIQMLIYGEVDG